MALYLVADVASVAGGLSMVGAFVASVAVAGTFASLVTRVEGEVVGRRRVGLLGVAGGLALLAAVEPRVVSLPVDVVSRASAAVAGALVLDLAIAAPKGPTPGRLWRLAVLGSALGFGAAGVLAVAPAFSVQERLVLVPRSAAHVPFAYAVGGAVVALLLRLWRRRGTDDPLSLASNAWAVLGLAPAVAFAAAAFVLRGQDPDGWARGLGGAAVLSALVGHVALVDPSRRLHVDRAMRHVLAALVTVAVVASLGALLAPWLRPTPTALAVAAALAVVVAALLHRAMLPVVHRILAPDGSRLLSAVERVEAALLDVRGLDALGRTVLGPLRDASRDPAAMPVLYAAHPPLEIRIDAAREPHVRDRALSQTILARLLEHPTEIIIRGALEGHVVRRTELRPLVEATQVLDALCVVPLRAEGDLEGALVVPQGRRRSLPSLEEIAALERLGSRVASMLVLLTAQERARRRTAEALRERDAAEERIDALEDELDRLRTEARTLRAGRAASRLSAPPVAYGPAMRALEERVHQVAPLEAPILLIAEGGTPIDQVALRIHEESGRHEGPFVVADCASVRPEHTLAALFGVGGDPPQPGWLQLASGGTLLLADVPGLSLGAQAALAEALGTRRGTLVGGAGAFPVDVRVVATCRRDLAPLVAEGGFDAELGRWLSKVRLEVPPLRERREDIPSLALLAIDRACRVLGREVMGMDQQALEVLLRHDWPGNLRELQHVVGQAVARASGAQVTRQDLPPLAPSESAQDLLAGSYATLEKRILRRALERADGNKSQAARLLGLKRTTFLDKLRRHDLDEGAAKSTRRTG
jgi:two-component system, NtrC family, response regulator HydG